MARKGEKEYCNVCGENCIAPAGWGGHYGFMENTGRPAGCKCFACGQPVCSKCSKKVKYHQYGTQRICDSCRATADRKRKDRTAGKTVKRSSSKTIRVSPLKREVASRGKMGRKTTMTRTTSAYSRKVLKRKR